MTKSRLRTAMRDMLRQIPPAEFHARGVAAAARLRAELEYQRARTLLTFLSRPDEIDTDPLIRAALNDGYIVAAPRVDWEACTMLPVRLLGLSRLDVATDPRGLRTPLHGDALRISDIELVVAPGLAFDAAGGRLGRGGGHFDRLLADPECRAARCGFAIEEQILNFVPQEPHDQRMSLLVTDARVVRTGVGA